MLLDMKAGFHNIPVLSGEEDVLGIVTQDGLFRYKRMAFGLKGAPLWFQYCMDTLLARAAVDCAKAFVDDVTLVGTCDRWKQLWDSTLRLLLVLTTAGFMVNLRKCKFLVPKAVVLGY